jgi:hypothetical protein
MLTAVARRCDDDKLLFSAGGQLEFTFIAVGDAVGAADFSVGQLSSSDEGGGKKMNRINKSQEERYDLVTNALSNVVEL